MKKNYNNIIFLVLLSIVFLFGLSSFVKPEQISSVSENRTLNLFPTFSLSSFLDGSFQDNFESALSDQFTFSEKIRVQYNLAIAAIPNLGLDSAICRNYYIDVPNSVDYRRAHFNCEDNILYYPVPPSAEQLEIVHQNIAKYQHINELTDTYFYFINDSYVYDFSKNQKIIDYPAMIQDSLGSEQTKIRSLDLQDYQTYKKYFYKTDHHWNYQGSYQGYLEIAELLGIEDPISPTGTFTSHKIFYGSHAQRTLDFSVPEEFTIYTFDIPAHDTFIDGEPKSYNRINEYISGADDQIYTRDTNYYGHIYGGDYAEVLFDFHQPEKENLLLISNSFSNAINELVAQHFDKTYVIDPRHYEHTTGEKFSITKFLQEHDIDKTLLVLNPAFITAIDSNQGLES